MSNMRKCFLLCLQRSNKPIPLPHNKSVIIGRNPESGITNTLLSRNQLQLIANVQSCTVEVIPLGVNPSGVNGFSLKRYKQYTLKHEDRIELLLDKYIYEVIFEPKPSEKIILETCNSLKLKRESDSNYDEDELTFKKQKINSLNTTTNITTWEDIDNKKLYIYTSESVTSRKKIAAYDLDGTIITTKSGARFPKDAEDWKFAYPEVPKKILDLHKNSYKIVIFTNQAGIALGKVKINELRDKIEKIVSKLNVPVQVFISTGKGVYRKPAPGMWDALCNQKNDNVEIDLKLSFYCGDAAGREKNWAPKMKKDHSIGDYLFALNIGISFKTPEEHFLNAKSIVGALPQFDPRNLSALPLLLPESSQLVSNNLEVIVFVGSPASGKSFVCKKLLVPKGYVHINRDKLGSWQKCVSALDNALQNKQNAVIDNTNPDKESRKRFIDITKKYGVLCRCFVMNTSIQQAKHNNLFREITDKDHAIVNDIIINSYKNKFQEPTIDEGFSEIVKVNCNPSFDNSEHERLYRMFLLEK